MSTIRKKSIKSTLWIYVGFLIGAVNTYFLTHKSWFTTEQNGLTRSITEIGQLVFAFSCLGATNFIFKFFPYYEDNLKAKKNDLLTMALIVALGGFVFTAAGVYWLQPLVIRKFSAGSMLLVQNFILVIPMGFFILLYNLLETYSNCLGKGVLNNFLKETLLRFYTMCLIVATMFNLISFHTFIILFAFQYALIVVVLTLYLLATGQLMLGKPFSKVTIKYRKKIFSILALTFLVIIVNVLRQSIDSLVLAAKQNLGKVGIFGLASYMVSVLQAPFRSLISITVPILSRAWKDKNHKEINRIYQRTSINMMAFSLFLFFAIWLNFEHAINFFNINPEYLEGKWIFFLLGMVVIIETGTGVNGQIIATSTFWRFELWTSLLLTALIIPLSYTLTSTYGIIGPAIANLVSFSVYNLIRIYFLWNKYKMQPFTLKTIELLLLAAGSYTITYYLTIQLTGLMAIVVSTCIYALIFIPIMYVRNISPDFKPVVNTLLVRVKLRKKEEQGHES